MTRPATATTIFPECCVRVRGGPDLPGDAEAGPGGRTRRRHSGNDVVELAGGLLLLFALLGAAPEGARAEEPGGPRRGAAPAAPAPAPAAPAEGGPWEGVLPDPRQGYHAPADFDPEWLCTRILDGGTGRPVEGARLSRYPERIDGSLARPQYLLDVVTADDLGFAWMEARSHHWSGDSHWVAMAPGYAPAYAYGRWPDREMLLRRGTSFRARLLDPLGAPVSGATVELFLGCGHSPAVRRATTGADGRFALADVRPEDGTLWIVTPAGRARYRQVGSFPSLGARERDIVLETGWTATGRVVDPEGEPLAGVVVRSWQEQRGPATGTDGDGRFSLVGVEPGHSLQFFLPVSGAERAALDDDAWGDGRPFTVRLSTAGMAEPPERGGTLIVRAVRGGAAEPAGGVAVGVVHASGGLGEWGLTSDEEADEEAEADGEPAFGEARFAVPAGKVRVVPCPGDRGFEPTEVSVPRGGTAAITVTVVERARLRIRGSLPPGAALTLATPGGEDESVTVPREGPLEWAPPLAAEGPAALRVECPDHGPVRVFPVGAVADGAREVVVSLPAPTRLRVPPWVKGVALFDGEDPAGVVERDGVWTTWATGPLRLRASGWGGSLSFPAAAAPVLDVELDIPAEGGGVVEPDLPRERARERLSATVRVEVPADGAGEVTFEDLAGEFDEVEGEPATVRAEPGGLLRVQREGWMPLVVAVTAGEQVARWGTAALELELLDGAGSPADALVCVDGAVWAAERGRVLVRGLEPGEHVVRAALRDSVWGGRAFRVMLAASETAKRSVTLGEE